MAAVASTQMHDPLGSGMMKVDSDDDSQAEQLEKATPDTWSGTGAAPAPTNPRHIIHAVVPFAGPYKSVFITKPRPAAEVLDCLKHVNCSYLSSGVAPNLLQLKQHAQSLTVLIKEMTVSTRPTLIDNAHAGLPGARPMNVNGSFDWLNDLNTPYHTDESHHLQPLTSILNMVEQDPVTGLTRNICPLQKVVDESDMVQPHPWATHENLIRHANEVLERLDHEYSARGGLLSIFPTDMQKNDREKAEKTMLGQMIFWVQNLVQRIHHLERLYANAMDLLAKEAVVPTETLSALGAKGRKGREVVYPQDRFVLVNAGDDLWDFLNAEFERKEVIDTQVDRNYRELGTTGEALWAERGGREFAKGITCIDVYTRYYRLRDSPLKTIFVIPAHEIHPGTKVTREMEQQPTVVSVVKPMWPERMSVLETQHKSDMADLKALRIREQQWESKDDLSQAEKQILSDNNATLKQEKRILTRERDDALNALKQSPNQFKLQVHKDVSKASTARQEAATARAIYEKQIADTKAALEQAKADAKEMQEAREKQVVELAARDAEREKEWAKRVKELEDRDADIGRAAQEAVPELKKVWLKQMTESQILIEFLNSQEAREALKDVQIPDHILQLGRDKGRRLYEDVARKIPDVVPQMESDSSSSSSDDHHGGGGGDDGRGGGGGPGGLQPAPSTATWRQRPPKTPPKPSAFSAGWSPRSSKGGNPRNVHFDELGKPKTGQQPSPKTPSSMHSHSPGWSPRLTRHGDPQNVHYAELSRSPTQWSPSRGRGSGSSVHSTHTQASGTPKHHVAFSPKFEQGPTGSGGPKRASTSQEQMGSNKKQKQKSTSSKDVPAVPSSNSAVWVEEPAVPSRRGRGRGRGGRVRWGRGGARGGQAAFEEDLREIEERERLNAETQEFIPGTEGI